LSVFVDTSALYAVMDRDDRFHSRAAATWKELVRRAEPLVTSNYVLVETFALVQRRLGMEAVRTFSDHLQPMLTITWVGEDDDRTAMSALAAADRRALSLVDCVSFHVMRNARIRTAFAFDPHFTEQGFQSVPGPSPDDTST
jgi:predicted nucleic acid-binding protein